MFAAHDSLGHRHVPIKGGMLVDGQAQAANLAPRAEAAHAQGRCIGRAGRAGDGASAMADAGRGRVAGMRPRCQRGLRRAALERRHRSWVRAL